jgi:dCTP deaminase
MLTYTELCALVDEGHLIGVDREHINAASIDLHLADSFLMEDSKPRVVDLSQKQGPPLREATKSADGSVTLFPGEVLLAKTVEVFNLPDDIAGLFILRSTPARAFLNHMHSGWIDPGFHGSPLTLQLKNELRHSCVKLCPGLRIGQVVFWRGTKVPELASYASRGNYNNINGIAQAKH